LASPHPVVVSAVVFRDEVGNDPDLRAKAREALLRHGDAIDWRDGAFAAWPVDPAAALATELLARDALLAGNSKRLLESAGALGRTKSAAVVPTLARLADHPNWLVRQRVANELGNTFSREAAPILLDMLKDLQEGVRKTAQASLDRIATYLDERVKWEQRLK
jgi:HEAT repeat protein